VGHLLSLVGLQSLLKALEMHTGVEVYYERRDQTFLIMLHNPFHPETRHSLAEWHAEVHSKVGFRLAMILMMMVVSLCTAVCKKNASTVLCVPVHCEEKYLQ